MPTSTAPRVRPLRRTSRSFASSGPSVSPPRSSTSRSAAVSSAFPRVWPARSAPRRWPTWSARSPWASSSCVSPRRKRVSLTGGPCVRRCGVRTVLEVPLRCPAVDARHVCDGGGVYGLASSVGLLVPALAGRGTGDWRPRRRLRVLVGGESAASPSGRVSIRSTIAKLFPAGRRGGRGLLHRRQPADRGGPAGGGYCAHVAAADFAFAGIEVALVPSGESATAPGPCRARLRSPCWGSPRSTSRCKSWRGGSLGAASRRRVVSPLQPDAAGASLGGWARSLLPVGPRSRCSAISAG